MYREDLLRPTDLSYEKPKFGGVLLTHAHIDHAGCIPFLDPGIPIYCSPLTQRILGAYQRTGRGGFAEEFLGGKWRPFGTYVHHSRWRAFRREFREPAEGPLQVKTFEVDHSTHGACGYMIQTSDATVAYTGDIRLHGPRGGLTRRFIDELEREGVDALIVEGTRVEESEENRLVEMLAGKPEPKLGSEAEVKQKSLEVLEGAKGNPVFVDFAQRDFDRLRTVLEVAQESGRQLVIPMKLAYFVRELGDAIGLKLEDFLIYVEPKSLGSYEGGNTELGRGIFWSLKILNGATGFAPA